MTERIVVAINGGAGSAAALNWALARVTSVPVTLELVAVVEAGHTPGDAPEAAARSAYEGALRDAEGIVRGDNPDLPVTTAIRDGSVRRELLHASAGADLLVVGTREPNGVFSGTLRHQLSAGARCAVVSVPVGWKPRGGPIVAGTDDDETSQIALRFAAREASRQGRELVVVHGWHVPVVLAAQWLSAGADPYVEIRSTHAAVLASSVDALRAEHPKLKVRDVLVRGAVSLALIEAAEEAELLIVGTHRRGIVPGLLLGSVSHDVLTAMPCPVIVVPHPDDEAIRVSNAGGDESA